MADVQASHVVYVGRHVQGPFTLEDGTVYDATPDTVAVDGPEHAEELAHLVGLHFEQHGHPDDVEFDEETGHMAQRPFKYDKPAKFKGYKPHPHNKRLTKKG